jgi:hypothetical protein
MRFTVIELVVSLHVGGHTDTERLLAVSILLCFVMIRIVVGGKGIFKWVIRGGRTGEIALGKEKVE